MRAWVLALSLVAGCTFSVQGTDAPPASDGPTLPPPIAATPLPLPDAGMADTSTPPPVSTPDMLAAARVGTQCMGDPQCSSGLVCGKSFATFGGTVKIPGGYCTLDCSKASCPAGSFCGSFSFGKFCLSECPPDPCRPGYKCCKNDGQMGCTPDDLCGDH
jgi:hypothetical protein